MLRVEELKYEPSTRPSTVEGIETNLFLTGPQEFLVKVLCEELKKIPVWSRIFGEFIDPYMRMDYGARNFPAMRIYCEKWKRDFETWYNNGDIKIDIIWPASIGRHELQQIPMTVTSAMEQQLSSPEFFAAIGARVPGLNELGKVLNIDMSMFFSYGDDDAYPFTRIIANYRINLDEWHHYMESDNRTLDDPFQRTLGDLKKMYGVIDAIRGMDPDAVDVELGIQQSTETSST